MSNKVIILNPASGTGDHVSQVQTLAADHGYTVRQTEREDHGFDLTQEAIEKGATFVAAAGGDGTLNEVIRGITTASALDDVTVGVVPCGTGNNFAGNIGVAGIEQAFEVLEHGERRQIDLGRVDSADGENDGRPFINSCVSGLTAEASAETSPELKRRFGTAAYVLETLRTVQSFDGIRVTVGLYDDEVDTTPVWTGSAIAVLIGNGRQFPPGGSRQANMEDGQFDVTLVTDTGSLGLLTTAATEAILERETPQTTRYTVPKLTISVMDDEPIAFSLDGEICHHSQLSLHTQPRALRIAVGDEYEPSPSE